jgi:thymidylate synthase (FAD)
MNVKLIHITPDCEKHIAYCARVSSPHQDNPEYAKLLNYCIKKNHNSIFEMGNMCIEIETTNPIAMQILRHKSFSFQQFSQRYQKVTEFEVYPGRRQDTKNRQNSIDDLSVENQQWFMQSQQLLNNMAQNMYDEALTRNIAKESARFLLTTTAKTKMYINGNIRSWIHYLQVRCGEETQLEHREIALAIRDIFMVQLPTISEAVGWKK